MRLATAMDEIEAVNDPRVQANEAYLPVVLLSRVVLRLGASPVNPRCWKASSPRIWHTWKMFTCA
jgi:hypothetical protein